MAAFPGLRKISAVQEATPLRTSLGEAANHHNLANDGRIEGIKLLCGYPILLVGPAARVLNVVVIEVWLLNFELSDES